MATDGRRSLPATIVDRLVANDPKQPAISLTGVSESSHLSLKLAGAVRDGPDTLRLRLACLDGQMRE